jgi:hypothetical protein
MYLWCQNGCMLRCLALSPLPVSAFALALLLPITRSAAYQPPVPQSEQGRESELKLTAGEEKDSYELYSMLLRTELPPQWKLTRWTIRQETQTFPNYANNHSLRECLQPSQDQESTYLPLIEDYTAKNKKKLVLDRKFDLPQYVLIPPPGGIYDSILSLSASVIFHVSAVGFNQDGTRALVYVGHNCGSLCGGGGYHLLVKKNGQWQVDREYRGLSCMWAS